MRGRVWPAGIPLEAHSLSIAPHSRGGAGMGGEYSFSIGGGARWVGQISIPALSADDAIRLRAFFHSLRGRAGSFVLPLPSMQPITYADPASNPCAGSTTRYSDCTTYSDATSYTDTWRQATAPAEATATVFAAAAGADTITLFGLAPSGIIAVGAWLFAGSPHGNGQLFRVTSVSGNVIGVRPRVRDNITIGSPVIVGTPYACFRLAGDTPFVPMVVGRSLPFSFEIEEYWLPLSAQI